MGPMRLYILDDQRRPIRASDVSEWQRWIKHREASLRIGVETIGESRVSTVFLAADASLDTSEEPLLFETMILGGPLRQERVRYATWEEAEAGHRRMVERVRGTVNPGGH
jgi:hypothetical protein